MGEHRAFPAAPPGPVSVLYVEDDDVKRYTLARWMKAAGFEVSEVATASAALDLLSVRRPKIVLLDVKLPDMDGFELCRRIKSLPGFALMPVLLVSAVFTENRDKVTGLEGGADGYLAGDVEPGVLIATIRALVRARTAEQGLSDSAARFHALFDHAATGMVVLSPTGYFQDVNEAFCSMLGRARDELLGAHFLEYTHPADCGVSNGAFETLLANGSPRCSFEKRYVRKDGTIVWAGVLSAVIRDASGRPAELITQVQDITGRKEAEQALRQREAELREAQRLAGIGSWFWNAATDSDDGKSSPELLRIFGLHPADRLPSFQEQKGRFYTAETWERLNAAARRAVETGEGYELEAEGLRADGTTLWLTIRTEPVRDDSGRVSGLRGTVEDITTRKRAGEQLRRAREEYRLLVENQTDIIARIRRDGAYGYVNPNFLRVFGKTEAEVLEKGFAPQTHPDDVARASEEWRHTYEPPDFRSEIEARTFTAQGWRWLSWRSRALFDEHGQPSDAICVGRDVTEGKEAEAALLTSQKRLEVALAAAGLGTWEVDVETGVVTASAITSAMFRFDAAPPRVEDWLARIHPGDRARVSAALGEAAAGRTNYETEYRVLDPDGSIRWVFAKAGAIADPSGRTTRLVGVAQDITARKDAEHRLREALAQAEAGRRTLDALMEHVPEGITIGDRDGLRLRLVSRRGQELLGAPHGNLTIEEYAGRWKVYRSDGVTPLPDSELPLVRAMVGGEVVENCEIVQIDSDGRQLQLLCNAAPIRDENGDIVAGIVAWRDIRERKEAESALAQAHAEAIAERNRLNAVMEALPVGVAILDSAGGQTRANAAFDDVWGGPRPQTLSVEDYAAYKAWWAGTLAALSPEDWASARAVLHGESIIGQFLEIERFDGRRAFVVNSAAPVFDSERRVVGCAVAIMDVTALREAEEALRESEDRLALAVRAAHEGVWDWNLETGYAFYSERWKEMLGYSGDDIEPHHRAWERLLHPDDKPRVREELDRAIRENREFESEFRLRCKDGRYLDILSRGLPLRRAADGKIARIVGTHLDLTQRKQAEERLRQAQKLESIGLLAGGIAHDFNNLLTGILGNTSLALDRADADTAALLSGVVSNAERAAHLTRQLLAYSGKGQFFIQSLDLSRSVDDMRDLLRLSVPKNVELRYDLAASLPPVPADAGQLQQLVMNLVINAAEAIGDVSTGSIRISTRVQTVDGTVVDAIGVQLAPGEYVSVEVADTGPGIEESVRRKIFDPFFTTKFAGRGLGLAAVAGIMRSVKGAVVLRTEPGKGSSFTLLFRPALQQDDPSRRWPGIVLAVDDEPYVREFLSAALGRRGYRVLTAADGQEALRVWDAVEGPLDLVILDVVMPVMGANELLPEIRRRQPGLAVLLTSGYSEAEARRLCAAFGATDFIQKPYTARQITAAVEKAISPAASAH